ncbi:hypothetical protein [Nocardia salmonicida]|uniref:hypothetical protein n=1 Tax=Nocardia salmonicida TaxID=53431 RepID=UPI0037A466BF
MVLFGDAEHDDAAAVIGQGGILCDFRAGTLRVRLFFPVELLVLSDVVGDGALYSRGVYL